MRVLIVLKNGFVQKVLFDEGDQEGHPEVFVRDSTDPERFPLTQYLGALYVRRTAALNQAKTFNVRPKYVTSTEFNEAKEGKAPGEHEGTVNFIQDKGMGEIEVRVHLAGRQDYKSFRALDHQLLPLANGVHIRFWLESDGLWLKRIERIRDEN